MTSPHPACSCCAGELVDHARAVVLGHHEARYLRCPACGFIRPLAAPWLKEAYTEAIAPSDTGLLRRNFILATVTQSVIRSFFKPGARFVDYGGGYGILVRLLRDAGYDFRRYDPLCPNLFARGFEAELPGRPDHALVTAFEVFEHLVDPRTELARMLQFSRSILFTTLLQPEPAPQPGDWWYYCLDTGQHVALYTRRALEALGRAHGLRLVTDGRQLHLFTDRHIPAWWFKLVSRYRVASLRCPFWRGSTRLGLDHTQAWRPGLPPPGSDHG